jgi:CheY-like chemotaxis protein
MSKELLIFLIDDDPDDQEIFSMIIGKIDPLAKCEFADDGVDALQKLGSLGHPFLPDLIFIDINMPRMNGLECLAEIRKLPQLINVPAYMYSTSDESFIVAKSISAGADGFVKKEARPKALEARLAKILTGHKLFTHQ